MQLSPAAGRVPTKPDRAQQDKDLRVRVCLCDVDLGPESLWRLACSQ